MKVAVMLWPAFSCSHVRPALEAAGLTVSEEVEDIGVVIGDTEEKHIPVLEKVRGVAMVDEYSLYRACVNKD